MTAQEFLQQGYFLDQRIESYIEEARALRGMTSLFPEQVKNPDDEFEVSPYEKLSSREVKVNREILRLVALREEIRSAIDAVANADERLVLSYRYILSYPWRRIATELKTNRLQVDRLHERALEHVKVPVKRRRFGTLIKHQKARNEAVGMLVK